MTHEFANDALTIVNDPPPGIGDLLYYVPMITFTRLIPLLVDY